jgi:hypothetical protein
MIKKMLLLFCGGLFVFSTSVSAQEISKKSSVASVFIDPGVAKKVIEKYFGREGYLKFRNFMNLHAVFVIPHPVTVISPDIATANAAEAWNMCVRKNVDHLVSLSCPIELCKAYFSSFSYTPSLNLAPWLKKYCQFFVADLITTVPEVPNASDCEYKISKVGGSQMRIRYRAEDGTGVVRSGGTIAWRFFNPGNLRRSPLACAHINTEPNGKFAAFDSYEKGRLALRMLLRGDGYKNLTIADAMSKYAPPSDNNNTSRYISNVKQAIKSARPHINVNTVKLQDLSDSELVIIMDAIERIEGWHNFGKVTFI